MRLQDRHVLVTGASRGVGKALTRELTRRGARVTALARTKDALDTLAQETGATAYPADLADISVINSLASKIESSEGPIDVLINNAALGGVGEFTSMSRQALTAHVHANLLAPMILTHAVLPGMISRGRGCAVVVSSVAGEMATRNATPYCTTKAGLSLMARNLQREYRRDPVTILLTVLGEVDTAMLDDVRTDPVMSKVAKRIGKLRALTPTQVASQMTDSIERDRKVLVLPPAARPIVGLRQIPSRLMDLALLGT